MYEILIKWSHFWYNFYKMREIFDIESFPIIHNITQWSHYLQCMSLFVKLNACLLKFENSNILDGRYYCDGIFLSQKINSLNLCFFDILKGTWVNNILLLKYRLNSSMFPWNSELAFFTLCEAFGVTSLRTLWLALHQVRIEYHYNNKRVKTEGKIHF